MKRESVEKYGILDEDGVFSIIWDDLQHEVCLSSKKTYLIWLLSESFLVNLTFIDIIILP